MGEAHQRCTQRSAKNGAILFISTRVCIMPNDSIVLSEIFQRTYPEIVQPIRSAAFGLLGSGATLQSA